MKGQHLILIFSLFLFSCTSKNGNRNRLDEEGVAVRVVNRMGEMPSDTIQYLPLIGSLAEGKNGTKEENKFLIIGKNLDNGDNLNVYPLATFVFESGKIEQKLKLCVPVSERFVSIPVKDFDEFATKYGTVKNAIENWYNHFAGLGKSRFLRWEHIVKE